MNRRGMHRKPQPDLFTAQIGHNGGPPRSRETRRFYEAVLFLRIYGAKAVWRVGAEHLVAGRQVSTAQLHQLCRAECRVMFNSDQIPPFARDRLGVDRLPI